MSFRPTIAIIVGNEIADIGYYRNWDTEDLFIEALGLAVIYRDCKTVEEVRDRAFGKQKIGYIIEPEVIDNTQENLRWLEDCSEFPIAVDLTRGAIYEGYCGASDESIAKKPDIKDLIWPKKRAGYFYEDILSKYKICFDKVDMDAVTDLFMKDEEIRRHLSVETAKKMREMISERMSGANDEAGVRRYRS